jgi:hypothetical protein
MSAVTQPAPINEDKVHAFLGKVVGDFGAALSCSLVYIGQKLGLYKALASGEAVTPIFEARKQNAFLPHYCRGGSPCPPLAFFLNRRGADTESRPYNLPTALDLVAPST